MNVPKELLESTTSQISAQSNIEHNNTEQTYTEKNYTTLSDELRISALAPNNLNGKVIKLVAPLLDKLLGVDKLRHIYERASLSGLDKQTFSTQLLNALGVNIKNIENIIKKIPKTGKCIVVSNHPYGMVEGIIIAKLLTEHRSDTKVMANIALSVFKEISDYFIFADPIRPKNVKNPAAIKQCFSHVENGGLLMIFPAGAVSTYQKRTNKKPEKIKPYITDAPWNRIAVNIAKKTNSPILPIFITGTNSPLFHNLGRLYFRLRLFMLAHEMFKLNGKAISILANNLLTPTQLNTFSTANEMNDFIRLQTYLNDPKYLSQWPADKAVAEFKTILSQTPAELMQAEIDALPEKQKLVTFKHFSVYYGYQKQLPQCVREITRLREITFRTLNEGSGEDCDTDKFDETYMHLFIFDHSENEIIGAYRIGQTDLLLKSGDISALYLAHMFNFDTDFVNQQQPCLEMGRSFIVEKHQASFHGLLLLWKGIGAFVCQNPHYRTLYGTVSLSKLYDPRSVALIDKTLVNQRIGVNAKVAFEPLLSPEVNNYMAKSSLNIEKLSAIVQGVESDRKDLPVLVKQYHKLGANFHCIGIDKSFNDTPGLLLSVDLPKAPEKLLKLYLGKGKEQYLSFQ